jgi:hypothetical protein
MALSPLFPAAQLALEIPAAIGDRHNLHPAFQNPERDRDATLETDGAQARQDIGAPRAALGGIRQAQAGLADTP